MLEQETNNKPVFNNWEELIEHFSNGQTVLSVCPAKIHMGSRRWWILGLSIVLLVIFKVFENILTELFGLLLASAFTEFGLALFILALTVVFFITHWRPRVDLCVLTNSQLIALCGLQETVHGISAAKVYSIALDEISSMRHYYINVFAPVLVIKLPERKVARVQQSRFLRLSYRYGSRAVSLSAFVAIIRSSSGVKTKTNAVLIASVFAVPVGFALFLLVANMLASEEGNRVLVTNECELPITVFVRYRDPNFEWELGGPWTLEPGASEYLKHNESTELYTYDPKHYYAGHGITTRHVIKSDKNEFMGMVPTTLKLNSANDYQLVPKCPVSTYAIPTIKNRCNETISVALHTKNKTGDWVTRGWYVVQANEDRRYGGVHVTDPNVYFYGISNSARFEWHGEDRANSKLSYVVSDSFAHESGKVLSGKNKRAVSLRHRNFKTLDDFALTFACKG